MRARIARLVRAFKFFALIALAFGQAIELGRTFKMSQWSTLHHIFWCFDLLALFQVANPGFETLLYVLIMSDVVRCKSLLTM